MPFEGESTSDFWRRTWAPEYFAEWCVRFTRIKLRGPSVMVDLAAANEVRQKDFDERARDRALAARIVKEATAVAEAQASSKMVKRAPTVQAVNEHVERLVREHAAEILGDVKLTEQDVHELTAGEASSTASRGLEAPNGCGGSLED